MKKAFNIIGLALALLLAFSSCQKAPFLTFTGQKSFTFKDAGGSETITFSCNRAWTVKSSANWLKVSPSQGDANEGGAKVTITCDANNTYDSRTATVTIMSEGLSEVISVSQDTNYGLFSDPNTFNLTNEAQYIEITVQANVLYTITIDDACKDWISQLGTKALTSDKLIFSIAANESHEDREGKITIREASCASSSVQPQVITVKQAKKLFVIPFEDANFKSFCVRNFDTDGDGEICIEEAEKVEIIACGGYNITSLKGIEYFTKLKTLNCSNKVSSGHKDPDGKMHWYDSNGNEVYGLTYLDVSKNIALTSLKCDYNQLATLDLSKNTALAWLECANNQLTSLDVNDCIDLNTLVCSGNQLTSLDVSGCIALTQLECNDNQLTSIDVSGCIALEYLCFYYNQLTSLDISNTALTWLDCSFNRLTSLDVSGCTALSILNCYNNYLTSLDISKNTSLTHVSCYYNQISTIYVWEGFDPSNLIYISKDDSASFVVKL